mmetsp:Transcript_38787/g.121189  ORF Transcript_38787/g.121189 Transcript_38787/m.121189 type:complete len:541 (-) Transcript_38787:190-1812(-)|eukprot:CAMPEP_0204529424 /NCGR_PEP_ID=MMETSP0661-20131031/10037_1 /ASSEMBLY_ACC=CAM_ASM_000606 /TAXON_ID=109239 /ORGANISM="Alexandrium margalefi, Strain AMGDE01CS-322" /LENGTH=540 /DNA_ID=CAMNT_0051535449 /DNA_START=311 /DNA_END=1933 /DNA_ORIENTATION=+
MARAAFFVLLAGPAVGLARETPLPLVLEDLNIVVTTDLHSWIEGREHEPHLNATLGHAVSFLERLRSIGRQAKRDIFFFDNGDINDGTGLSASAADHVAYLGPLLQRAPYDALNIGNHELYTRNGGGAIGGPACPIVGLRDSGYIANWKGRYLTSNVVWADSREPVGSRFKVVEGEFGTQLLVFGFLYNMDDHCNAVDVENVSEVVRADWFAGALKDHGARSDAVVILFHIDYRDELVEVVLGAVRAALGKSKPVQVLAGHSHTRGWRRLDGFASSYEAGCKLDTVGFTSFSKRPEGGASRLWFNYADLDGNTATLSDAVNVSDGALLTPAGEALIGSISETKRSLGISKVLGCADEHYSVRSALGEADSLWTYYMSRVLPGALFDRGAARPQWSLVGTGALTYDVYPGPFTADDAYKASPYGNFWFIAHKVDGSALAELLARLNAKHGAGARRLAAASWAVPWYVNSSVPVPAVSYDLIYCDFDAFDVEEELAQLVSGGMPKREVYRPLSNTSSVLVDWFKGQPCPTPAPTALSRAFFA